MYECLTYRKRAMYECFVQINDYTLLVLVLHLDWWQQECFGLTNNHQQTVSY